MREIPNLQIVKALNFVRKNAVIRRIFRPGYITSWIKNLPHKHKVGSSIPSSHIQRPDVVHCVMIPEGLTAQPALPIGEVQEDCLKNYDGQSLKNNTLDYPHPIHLQLQT